MCLSKPSKATCIHFTWHAVKAALVAAQVAIIQIAITKGVNLLAADMAEGLHLGYALIHLGATIAVAVYMLHYYDTIDDRSYRIYGERLAAGETSSLWHDRGWQINFLLSVLANAPAVTASVMLSLILAGMGTGITMLLSLPIALVLLAGIRALQIHRRGNEWKEQIALEAAGRKGKKYTLRSRILYAVILLVSVYLLCYFGITIFLPVFGSLAFSLILFFWKAILVIAGILLIILEVIPVLRQLSARRKFLKRINKLREAGEISCTFHGRPYLSVLSENIYFGMTIVDKPHPDGKRRVDQVYQVGIANCKRRKSYVILCDENIYQFMYTVQMRGMVGKANALGMTGRSTLAVPLHAWFTSHLAEFPEGEGEKILLIDPAPRNLVIRGHREGELLPLDNGSKVFGYTAYGKNAFVNLLERT